MVNLEKQAVFVTSLCVLLVVLGYRDGHHTFGLLGLLAYVWLFVKNQKMEFFWMAFPFCWLGSTMPDWDIWLWGIGAHRNPVFHSSAFAVVFYLLFRRIFPRSWIDGFVIGISSHLMLDIVYFGHIRYVPGKFWGKMWLGGHSIVCGFLLGDKKC